MGTDVRKLVADGYTASNVLGCELRSEYISLGHELFSSSPSSCPIHFFSDDIFEAPPSPPSAIPTVPFSEVTKLKELQGRVTHLYTGALFHLFDEKTQEAMARRIALLVQKQRSGVVVFGRHQGKKEAGMISDHMSRVRYGHSPSSWEVMWKKVFGELEGEEFAEKRVKVDAELLDHLQRGFIVDKNRQIRDAIMLYWSVEIV